MKERVPFSGRLATGVVEPYRESQVGFEVGGRVTFVRDMGQEIFGPLFDGEGELLLDEDGAPRRQGEVIALIDDTRYRQAVEAVELKHASTLRQLAAQKVDLERVAFAEMSRRSSRAPSRRGWPIARRSWKPSLRWS